MSFKQILNDWPLEQSIDAYNIVNSHQIASKFSIAQLYKIWVSFGF